MCVFCKIVAGEIPAYKVYEDDKILAFLDAQPINFGHTLIIPKKHYQSLEEIPEEELESLILVAKKLGAIFKANLKIEGYNLSLNNGKVAGQEVPHLHFHLIPRYADDGYIPWSRKKYGPGEEEETLKKIKGGLESLS